MLVRRLATTVSLYLQHEVHVWPFCMDKYSVLMWIYDHSVGTADSFRPSPNMCSCLCVILILLRCSLCIHMYCCFNQVLDEADRLVESSFAEDLDVIFSALPAKRQTLLFGATLTGNLKRLKDFAHGDTYFWQASIK